MDRVKTLDLTIDSKNNDDGVKQLLHEIKPNWQWTHVEKTVLSGGHSCVLLRCYETDNREDSVTIRIRNAIPVLGDLNTLEVKTLKYLAEKDFFPDLLATFNNGYCYRYIKGKPAVNLATGDVNLHDTMLRATARKMALLHTIKIPDDTDMNTHSFYSLIKPLITTSKYVPQKPEHPTKEDVFNECSVLENFCKEMKTRVGLCHGDLHPGNMVWNQETETITFVDWELVHVGFQYSDIAHFLGNIQTLYRELIPTFAPHFDIKLIPHDMGETFCTYYYEEWCRLQHKEIIKTEFDNFKTAVEKFKLPDAYLPVMYLTIMPNGARDFMEKNPAYCEKATEVYLNYKEKFTGRREFG